MARARIPSRSNHELVFRSARKGEEGTLATVAYRAFQAGDPEAWLRYFTEHAHLALDNVIVAETDGQIVGHVSSLDLTMSFAGADVPFQGLASAAVLPEFRRRGIADRLVRESLRRMRRRGEALTLLHPFRLSFYRRFGFGVCELRDVVRTSPDRLPDSVLRRHVRAFSRPRDEPLIKQAYDVARTDTTGQLKRSEYWWDVRVFKRSPSGAVYVDPGSKAIAGYLLFDVPEGGAYGVQQLLVRELRAPTPGAYRGLIGFLGALGDQYEVVELMLPRGYGAPLLDEPGIRDEPVVYETAARHPALCPPVHAAHRRNVLGLTAAGAMGRIIDVPAALALHPSPRKHGVRGAIGLDVEDPVFTDAPRAFDVTFAARGVQTAPGSTAGDRLSLSIERLTQIYFGATSARDLLSQGFVVGSAKAAALLDAAFAGPPLFLGTFNGF
ncbi:enhanced intracellular survival protein Eis [Sorangium sp. So ce118]|jgi:predicted acetyltransferase